LKAETLTTLRDHLQQAFPEARRFLSQIVGINSFTKNATGVRENAACIVEQFRRFGFRSRIEPCAEPEAGDHLFLDSGGEGPAIVLISHLDTVYSPEEQHLAYNGWAEVDGIITGPGVFDIKGGTAMMWMVIDAFQKRFPEEFRAIRWILAWNAAEEVLTPDFLNRFLETKMARVAAALVFEGDNKKDQGFEVVVSRSGLARFLIRVHGCGAHSGNGHADGANAIVQLAQLVSEVSSRTNYTEGTTVNVGIIRGGASTNRVPDLAEAELEIRSSSPPHYRALVDYLFSLAGEGSLRSANGKARCSVEVFLQREIPPWSTGAGNGLLDLWEDAARISGHQLTSGARGGLSDANYFSPLFPALDGLGPRGGNAHSFAKTPSGSEIREFADLGSFTEKALINTVGLFLLARQSLDIGNPLDGKPQDSTIGRKNAEDTKINSV